jgi:hypothetical protein
MEQEDAKGALELATAADLFAAEARRRERSRCGPWTLDFRDGCLVYGRGGMEYFVALDEMVDSARILDWIFQVNDKSWASREDVGHLVEAIEDLLGRDVAGGGVDHPIAPKAALTQRYGISFR